MGEAATTLRDGRGRKVRYLRISITDRCNLRCLYCMPPDRVTPLRHDRILSYEQILDLADLLIPRGIDKIRLTGGEPLVRRGALDLFARLGERPLRELTLTTNGMLLEECAGGLAEAGVRRVNVSLDSLRSDRYREITGSDELRRVIRGIDRARELGMAVKLNTVVMENKNRDEVGDLLRFAVERSCHVRFIEVMPHVHNALVHRRLYVPMQAVLDDLRRILPVDEMDPGEAGDGSSTERVYRVRGTSATFGLISPLSRHFCGRCDKIRITPDGGLKACLFQEGVSLREGLDAYRSGGGAGILLGTVAAALARKPSRHTLVPTAASWTPESGHPSRGPDLVMHQTGG